MVYATSSNPCIALYKIENDHLAMLWENQFRPPQYDGQLVHILDLPVHSMRLAADTGSNIFYSVALEPDYRIAEYDLSSAGL